MLKKLLKHDWISLSKKILVINLALVIVTILGIISFQTPLWTTNIPYLNILAGFLVLLNVIAFIIAGVGTIIYLATFFYKNLFTDEGYLMHTLPVKSWQLILSKLLTGFLAQVLTIINIIVCIILLIIGAVMGLDSFSAVPEMFEDIAEIFKVIAEYMNMDIVLFAVTLLIASIISALSSIMIIYGALCIGQMFSKRRILWSIVFYFVLYTVQQSILILGLSFFSLETVEEIDSYSYTVSSSGDITELADMAAKGILDMVTRTVAVETLITALIAVGLFFFSKFIIDRKLNLE